MRLYLDEDSASAFLVRLLRKAGHDVQTPADVGNRSKKDPVQLTHSIQESRAFLTRNYCDFEDLHNLILQARGHHPGILVVRKDQPPKGGLSPHGIVRAIANLLGANLPLEDSYHVLNHWR